LAEIFFRLAAFTQNRQRKNIDESSYPRLDFAVMKWFFLPPLVISSLFLTHCGGFNKPLSGDFDPLTAPGAANKTPDVSAMTGLQPGQYVTAVSNSTAFFSNRPTGNAEAEQLLAAGTSMRVVKVDGSFVKVELDNGQVGYVSSVMVTDGKSTNGLPSGEIQVYPPVGGDTGLPLPLPGGGLPADLQPAASPLPPSDLGNGTPAPPIEPPSIPELPPAAADKKPSAPAELPAPAAETERPAPPIGAPKKP
jgi:hypothetical protein